MEIFYIILVLLFITRAFGEVAVRLGQPVLVGELLSGIAEGMLIHWFPVRLRQTGSVGTAKNAYIEQDRKDLKLWRIPNGETRPPGSIPRK